MNFSSCPRCVQLPGGGERAGAGLPAWACRPCWVLRRGAGQPRGARPGPGAGCRLQAAWGAALPRRGNKAGLTSITEMRKPRVCGGSGSTCLWVSSGQAFKCSATAKPQAEQESGANAVSCGSGLPESWQSQLGAHSPVQTRVSEVTAI